MCVLQGARMLRVHQVGETVAAVRVIEVSSERSVVERLMRPKSGKADAHLHRASP